MTTDLADRAPRHSVERLVGPPVIRGLTQPWQTDLPQLRRIAMFVAAVRSHDPSKPHRGGMDCPTQPRAAPTGLGNILMDIFGYKHATPTGFGISRRVRRRPTSPGARKVASSLCFIKLRMPMQFIPRCRG